MGDEAARKEKILEMFGEDITEDITDQFPEYNLNQETFYLYLEKFERLNLEELDFFEGIVKNLSPEKIADLIQNWVKKHSSERNSDLITVDKSKEELLKSIRTRQQKIKDETIIGRPIPVEFKEQYNINSTRSFKDKPLVVPVSSSKNEPNEESPIPPHYDKPPLFDNEKEMKIQLKKNEMRRMQPLFKIENPFIHGLHSR